MGVPKLTVVAIRSMAPGDELRDAAVPGLYVTHRGRTRAFGVQFQLDGRRRRVKLGTWPAMSIDDARMAAWSARENGAMQEDMTIAAAVRQYERERLDRQRTGGDAAAILRRELVARYGEIALADLRRRDLAAMFAEIAADRHRMASRALTLTHSFLEWALAHELVEANVAHGLKRTLGSRVVARERVLTDAELVAIWSASARPAWYGELVKLLILTGQRRGEVVALGRNPEWLGADGWVTIPGAQYKTGRAHRWFAAHPVRAILSAFRPPRTASWGRLKDALDQESGITGWTLHDLRRTAATGWQKMGVEPHVVELMLGHMLGGVGGTYRRHTYHTEVKAAFTRWAARRTGQP
jgi:integrase